MLNQVCNDFDSNEFSHCLAPTPSPITPQFYLLNLNRKRPMNTQIIFRAIEYKKMYKNWNNEISQSGKGHESVKVPCCLIHKLFQFETDLIPFFISKVEGLKFHEKEKKSERILNDLI
jgi:hypothetical protein